MHALEETNRSGSDVTAECSECGRVVIIGPNSFEVLVRGDFSALHSFGQFKVWSSVAQ